MANAVPESDWKLFRKLRERALDRLYANALRDAEEILSSSTSNQERFRSLFKHFNDRDSEIADAFDDPRRSMILIQLSFMCRLGLVEQAELSGFSDDTREFVSRIQR